MENEFEENEAQQLNLTVDVQVKSACERHVKIEVAREDVDRYFDREYEELRETASIPGFRAGKAPRKLIESASATASRARQPLLSKTASFKRTKIKHDPDQRPDFDFRRSWFLLRARSFTNTASSPTVVRR